MDYKMLNAQLQELIKSIPYETANFANASALLYQFLPDLNWAGFYFIQDGQLILGPFSREDWAGLRIFVNILEEMLHSL